MNGPGRGGSERPSSSAPDSIESIIAASAANRSTTAQRRSRRALGVSIAVTVVWLVAVTIGGGWGRVADHWAAALTMVFGSFVAGSTPQGGGAVAFPVFTKILSVPTEVARSFSLMIQTVGMGAAGLAILLSGRTIVTNALKVLMPVTIASFLIANRLLADNDAPFAPSTVPGPYVKVSFTVVLAAMAAVVALTYRQQILVRRSDLPPLNGRALTALVIGGIVGGVASSLVGSGADVATYIVVVVLLGVNPRVGVPTSVLLMASVSIVGFIDLGLIDGQMLLERVGDQIVAVGGDPISPLPAAEADLAGMWLAAVPIVAWGAPLGSLLASRATDRQLVGFVVALALAEVISTIIFLEPLRTDPALAAFGIIGLIAATGGLAYLQRNRVSVLGLPAIDGSESFGRSDLDVGRGFRRQLEDRSDEGDGR